MSKHTELILTEKDRQEAKSLIDRAPIGTFVTFQRNRRSLKQSNLMWARLGILSKQLAWHGKYLSSDNWKLLLLAGYGKEVRVAPAIDGNGYVPLETSSSRLLKDEMTEFLDFMEEFAAGYGIEFPSTEDFKKSNAA